MADKKFLIVTYYWPPSGGAGVMRWLKMTRYIGQAGWAPVVYTPLDGEIAVEDTSLLQEVADDVTIVRRPIWEPYKLYKLFLGRSRKEKLYSGFINAKKKPSLAQRFSVWVRGNFFIPDARMFWIRPSARFLAEYLRENPVDAIVTTGPPHSMHLIGLRVHRATGIPWVADFRDPWTNIDFYRDLHLTPWADARHHRLERTVLDEATRVVAVTWRSRDEFKAICGRDDIEVIPNGFDDADFPVDPNLRLDEQFTIVHFGSMNKDRNPEGLWRAVKVALATTPDMRRDVKIKLYGPTDFSVRASIEANGLGDLTTFIEYLPHAEVVRLQQKAQVLLLVINNSPNARTIIPGKLYEYLGSRRPMLAIGPRDSDSAMVIRQTGAGEVIEYDDVDGLTARLLADYAAYRAGTLRVNAEGIEQFTRRHLAFRYARLLDEITGSMQPGTSPA